LEWLWSRLIRMRSASLAIELAVQHLQLLLELLVLICELTASLFEFSDTDAQRLY
jgi:hypothetical protein